ncbi:MAG: hypothetical protein M0010_02560 [Actinomycetota bacterium]|jgi:hypothetical protein|nr:hypothetical protein [Actinomycetota bacterium]
MVTFLVALAGALVGATGGAIGTATMGRHLEAAEARRQARRDIITITLPSLLSAKADSYSSGSYHAVLLTELERLRARTVILSVREERLGAALARTWRAAVPGIAPPTYRPDPIVGADARAAIDRAHKALDAALTRKLRPLGWRRARSIEWPMLGLVDPESPSG